MPEKNEVKLLPCPFCGGEAVVDNDNGPYDEHYAEWVECRKCLIRTCPRKKADIKAWNTRHHPAEGLRPLDAKEFYAEVCKIYNPYSPNGTSLVMGINSACAKFGTADGEKVRRMVKALENLLNITNKYWMLPNIPDDAEKVVQDVQQIITAFKQENHNGN